MKCFFYKSNLIIENNISGKKHVSKATLHLDVTDPHNAEEFIQGYCDHNTAQKMKFSIQDFSTKGDQIRSFLRMW